MDTKRKIKCPACGNELTKIKAGRVQVDACVNGCGGIWFDQFELDDLNQPSEKAGKKLLNINRNPNIVVNKNKSHVCPVCNVKMYNYTISFGVPFVADECTECGGFWLDGGEFEMLRNDSGIADVKAFDTVEAKLKLRDDKIPFYIKLYYLLTGE